MGNNLPILTFEDNQLIAGEKAAFDKGKWSYNDLPMPSGPFLALCTARKNVRFHGEGEGPPEVVARKPGEQLPDVDQLNEKIPQKQWRIGLNGEPEPPWKRWFIVIFLDIVTAQLFTHANATTGAKIATLQLEQNVEWMRALKGAEVMPLFELGSVAMKNKYQTLRPDFRVIGWRVFDGGALRIVDQNTSALKAIAPPSLKEELNDEIPDFSKKK